MELDLDTSTAKRPRIAFIDTLRGFTILSMAVFHATYDVVYIYGMNFSWFTSGPWQDVWRDSISWTFLFLAGWMTSFSRNNARRAARYGAAAVAVFAVTTIAAVDTPINFGIIACMASVTAIYALAAPHLRRLNPLLGLVLFLTLFCITYAVPRTTYPIEGFAWLGFPSPTFMSGDYYPLVPFAFMYLAGTCAVRAYEGAANGRYPSWMTRDICAPLTTIGRHSLVIYLIHQPVILLMLMLVFQR